MIKIFGFEFRLSQGYRIFVMGILGGFAIRSFRSLDTDSFARRDEDYYLRNETTLNPTNAETNAYRPSKTYVPAIKSTRQPIQIDTSASNDTPKNDISSFWSPINLTHNDLYERNYFYMAWISSLESEKGNEELIPVDVLVRYISEHSQQQLEIEWKEMVEASCPNKESSTYVNSSQTACVPSLQGPLKDRRYLVATYSCPIESGNRMHRFMNGLLWAVLTNRTFLWRYESYEICQEYDEPSCATEYDRNLIRGPEDCNGLLHRSPWIPSYDDWNGRLGFGHIVQATVDTKVTGTKHHDATTLPYDGVRANGTANNDATRLIRPGKQVGLNPGYILTVEPVEDSIHISQHQNLERLRRMRSKGIYFLYGMLFESLFTLDPSLDPPSSLFHNDNTQKTFFVHSRHTGSHPDTYIWPEHMCLEKIAPKNNGTLSCHIYVLSDRPVTVGLLHDEIKNTTDCTSSSRDQYTGNNVNVNNSEMETPQQSISFSSEHGPRAGRGYWEDLALGIRSRHGMIAFAMYRRPFDLVRTSTAIMRELIEFRRQVEMYQGAKFSEFIECKNPWMGI